MIKTTKIPLATAGSALLEAGPTARLRITRDMLGVAFERYRQHEIAITGLVAETWSLSYVHAGGEAEVSFAPGPYTVGDSVVLDGVVAAILVDFGDWTAAGEIVVHVASAHGPDWGA
jgi:hypothetical protein